MAVKRWVPVSQINGVAASSTATINLVTGPRRYHTIILAPTITNAGGATEANMATYFTEIRVNLEGTTQRRMSAQQLFDLNRQKGKTPTVATGTTVPGHMTLMFSEPQRKGIVEREATCWGMSGVNSFQIEIDIAAGVTGLVLKAWALIDDVDEPPMGIVKWKREIIQVSATGDLTYKLDTNKGDSYQSLTFIEGTAGDIDGIELTWDGVQLYKDDENTVAEYLNLSDYTKVSKYRHIPLGLNVLANNVPTVKRNAQGQVIGKVGEFTAKLTMGAAANVTLIREVVGSPD